MGIQNLEKKERKEKEERNCKSYIKSPKGLFQWVVQGTWGGYLYMVICIWIDTRHYNYIFITMFICPLVLIRRSLIIGVLIVVVVVVVVQVHWNYWVMEDALIFVFCYFCVMAVVWWSLLCFLLVFSLYWNYLTTARLHWRYASYFHSRLPY